MIVTKCDKCGKLSENPQQDGFCKVLIYKDMQFHKLGRGMHYKHYQFCDECKKGLLQEVGE